MYFFFQAEDGIRDYKVTGVQTCALPIFADRGLRLPGRLRGVVERKLHEAIGSGRDRLDAIVAGLVELEHRRSDRGADRKSTRLNSSHLVISYAVFCLKNKDTTVDNLRQT